MSDTPSGNRWEPADDATQPITPQSSPTPLPAPDPAVGPEPLSTAASPAAPPAGATTPEYGWSAAPLPTAPASRREKRRTGLLVAGAAALVLGSGALGYAVGAAATGSDTADPGTTRQAPPDGFGPGLGAPQHDDGDDDGDHDELDGPGSDGGSDDGSDGGSDDGDS